MSHSKTLGMVTALCALALGPTSARALTLGPDFAADYTAASLGSVPGLPPSYGGLTFLPGDPDTLLIGGNANTANGRLYTIGVVRDGDNHVTGFTGTATVYRAGAIGEYNDGGVTFGPNGVLFTARWNEHELGQTKPGSVDEDRIDDMSPVGVPATSSISGIGFVPGGFAGAGQLKMVTWAGGDWCTVPISPDGAGTFDLGPASCTLALGGGPEGFVYIDAANPGFSADGILVSEWSAGRVAAYEIDASGDPIVATRRDFLTDLSGAEGAVIDPLTGDFLFSTFGGGDRVIVVQGFTVLPPPASVPEPSAVLLIGVALAGFAAVSRRRHDGRWRAAGPPG